MIDSMEKENIYQIMKQLKKDGKTIIFTTTHLFRNLGIRTKYSCIPTYF